MLWRNTFLFTIMKTLPVSIKSKILAFSSSNMKCIALIATCYLRYAQHRLRVVILMKWRLLAVLIGLLSQWQDGEFHQHQLVTGLNFYPTGSIYMLKIVLNLNVKTFRCKVFDSIHYCFSQIYWGPPIRAFIWFYMFLLQKFHSVVI